MLLVKKARAVSNSCQDYVDNLRIVMLILTIWSFFQKLLEKKLSQYQLLNITTLSCILFDYSSLCVKDCGKGYYKKVSEKLCALCDKSCATCSDGGATSCTSCEGDLLLDSEGHCSDECPTGFFPGQ